MARVAAENQLGACVAKGKKFLEDLAVVAAKCNWQVEQYEYITDLLITGLASLQETACAPKAFEQVKSSTKLLERLSPDEISLFHVSIS